MVMKRLATSIRSWHLVVQACKDRSDACDSGFIHLPNYCVIALVQMQGVHELH